ncbi:uncharacterized protein LOC135112191 isoform X2 [Scylla paramamosain]|uniref:uncharacterized protein LOC135112191 isoform X2 n=1 Tax=Scylla paramamosain TaxID=85552 RepID=UPI0030833E90
MEPRVVIVLALLGAVSAAPQLWLSEKSHLGLEQALAGRIPGIYKGYEGRGSDVIVLNILGLSNPVGRDDFDLGSPESNELLPSTGGVPLPEVLKRPRRSFGSSDDEEDRPDPFAGLPLLGSLLVLYDREVMRRYDTFIQKRD